MAAGCGVPEGVPPRAGGGASATADGYAGACRRPAVGCPVRGPRRAPGDARRAGRSLVVGFAGPEALLVPVRHPGRARAGSCSCSGCPPQAWRLRCRLRNRRGVSESSPLLDRAGIEHAFRRLGERLAKRGVVADLYVFGGAAMALAFDSRRATRDVDALFKPHGIVLEEAQAVAAELDLPRWWLNKQASSYVAPGGDSAASRVFDHPGLRVFAASPEHLLAMKALAARPRDAEDIRQLAQVLDLHSVDDVLASVREIFPEEEPPARLGLLLKDIFADQDG